MATTDQPKIVLYWLDRSRSHRIAWLLEELKVPYELKAFKRGEGLLAPPELKQVHPLGKSPLLTVQAAGAEKPIVIAESGNIVEYLIEHFGAHMEPKRYNEGREGAIGGETDAYLRYRHLMHYAEATLMSLLVVALIIIRIKEAPVPFFIKPILRIIGGRVESQFLTRNLEANFDYVESLLASVPGGGDFFCGDTLSGADIMMLFPLEGAFTRGGADPAKYPKTKALIDRIHQRDAYKASVKRAEETTNQSFEAVISGSGN